MILYLSGPIYGHPDYRERFREAEEQLRERGHVVLNPCILPRGMEYWRYMRIDLSMVDVADGIVMLPGWKDSGGARVELRHAMRNGKKIFYGVPHVICHD